MPALNVVHMQYVYTYWQENSLRGCGGCHRPLEFSLSAHLPNINSALQRCIAEKTQGKSYLSANLARAKSICWQIGVVHPTNFFSFAPAYLDACTRERQGVALIFRALKMWLFLLNFHKRL